MQLLGSIADFVRKVKEALVRELNRRIPTKGELAEKEVREFTRTFFKTTDTYRSLIDGGLQGSFGFPQGTEVTFANWLVDTIADNIQVRSDIMRVSAGNYFGSVRVTLSYEVYQKLLTGVYSHVPIEDGSLPWIEWLLIRGDDIIINDFHIVFKPDGRTGIAIMGKGGFWKVPAKHSGTEEDNWITRTTDESEEYIKGLISILSRILL